MDSSQEVVVNKINPLCQCHSLHVLRADVDFPLVGSGSRVVDIV